MEGEKKKKKVLEVKYYIVEGIPYSYTTGNRIKLDENNPRFKYVPVEPPGENFIKKKRKASYDARRARHDYNREKAIPNYKDYIALTMKGEPRKVGLGKDSLLTQLNTSYAMLHGYPLNKQNRNLLDKIYYQEIAEVMNDITPKTYQRIDEILPEKGSGKRKYTSSYYQTDKPGQEHIVKSSMDAYEARRKRFHRMKTLYGNNPYA